jgi:hypothetical protein
LEFDMSDEPNDSPAFPETRPGGYGTTAGLTKRDYFAIRFATAIISQGSIEPDDNSRDGVAQLAMEYADALLARLDGEPDAATSQHIALGIGGGK